MARVHVQCAAIRGAALPTAHSPPQAAVTTALCTQPHSHAHSHTLKRVMPPKLPTKPNPAGTSSGR
jgi:hypothetical protein